MATRKSKPKQPETLDRAAESTAFLLHALGYAHLRARVDGKSVVIESGSEEDPLPQARLSRLSGDNWRIVVAEGEAIAMTARDITAPQMMFRYARGSVGEYAHRWVAAGPSHHMVAAYGHLAGALAKVADMLKVEIVVV